MATVICKLVDGGTVDSGSYSRLLNYMTNPQKDNASEKCVAYIGENFFRPDLSADEMSALMMADLSLSTRVKDGVDHWVLSFGKTAGEEISTEQVFRAVRQWMDDMGYGEPNAYKWVAAIHQDTDHLHCHMAVCRMNILTGKIKQRGMWKLANQRALARMAKENGWELEKGSKKYQCHTTDKPTKEVRQDSITGEKTTVKRPHVRGLDEDQNKVGQVGHVALNKQGGVKIAIKWPKPKNPPDEVDKIIALLKAGKYKNLPVTKEIGEELERRGIPVNRVPLTEWENNAQKLNYRIQKQEIKDTTLNYVNDKNTAAIRASGSRMWTDQPERREKTKFKPGDKVGRKEYYSGVKSDLRILHEKLTAAYIEMEPNLDKLKWGQIHEILARHGIEMQKREHPNGRCGLVFSLDGKNWTPASKVFSLMTWGALNGHIGAKPDSWRDIRPETRELLNKMRESMDMTQPMPEAEKKLTFNALSKSQVYALRDIDLATARKSLKEAGFKIGKSKSTKPVKTAIDVAIHECGLPYHDAVETLAGLFPEVVKLGEEQEKDSYEKIIEMAKQEILSRSGKWQDYEPGSMGDRCGREMVRWWQALQLDHIDLHTNIYRANEVRKDREWVNSKGKISHGILPYNKNNCTLPELLAARPQLMAIMAAGGTGKDAAHIFCTPHWRDGKIGIMLDDVKDSFVKKYLPSAIVHTSSESRQAFYIIDKKFEIEFYDYFMRLINAEYGDPKVLRTHHDTRVAGLFNRKRDIALYDPKTGEHDELVKVESSTTAYPKEFAALAEEYHAEWQKDRVADARPTQRMGRPKDKNYEDLGTTFKSDDPKFKAVFTSLQQVELPQWVENLGLETRDQLVEMYAGKLDRSRVDAGIARALYQAGANPDQVFTFFTKHLTQLELPGKERLETAGAVERQARRLATNLAPAWISPGGWRAGKEKSSQTSYKMENDKFYTQRTGNLLQIREEQQQSQQQQSQKPE